MKKGDVQIIKLNLAMPPPLVPDGLVVTRRSMRILDLSVSLLVFL